MQPDWYWSSTEDSSDPEAKILSFYDYFVSFYLVSKERDYFVRACLVF